MSPASAPGAQDAQREFLAAMDRVRRSLPESPDSPDLQSFVIHDYLVAARLRHAISTNPSEELDGVVDKFIDGRAAQPVVRALRREWLLSLAARKRWDWFLARSLDVAEPVLICDRLSARLAVGDTAGLAREALARWSTAQKQPDECSAIFAWLRQQGLLTGPLAESRTRAALAAENPRLAADFVADVPAPRAAPLLQWIRLLETPRPAIDSVSDDPTTPVEAEALVAGFSRLSTGDCMAAAAALPALLRRPDLSRATQVRLLRALALGAAYSRAPNSVAAFDALPAEVNDVQVQEWRVRAALWAGNFAKASQWIAEMVPGLAAQPRWRYWRARTLAATTGAAGSALLYAEIASMRDYYGYLAADRIDQPYNLNVHPSPDDPEAQNALAADAALMRAHALFDSDMVDDAAAEWASTLGGTKPAIKVQAAHLAFKWGWYAQTIATLAQAGEWDDVPLRYPRPYQAIVDQASKEAGMPGDWIYAVMRQESLYRKDAVSRADARGLMQMLPGTAVALARRWHFPTPSRDSLFEPVVAIKLGSTYLHELLDRYGGQLVQSLAAYNAGPVSVARWTPPAGMDADIWIENVPYTETRGYVQHILEHIVAFAAMRDAEPPRLTTLLSRIEPAGARAPAPLQ